MATQSFPPPLSTVAPTLPPPQMVAETISTAAEILTPPPSPPSTEAEAIPPPFPAARIPPPPTPPQSVPPPQSLVENIPPPPSTVADNIPPQPSTAAENIPPPSTEEDNIPPLPSTASENNRRTPPTLEELSRRGVRALFLPRIRTLIANSRSPPPPPGWPREFVLFVNFRTRALRIFEASGRISQLLHEKEGPLPASKVSIEALRRVDIEEGFECSICFGEGLNDVKEMPCKHLFHSGCIGKWLGIHGSCPICRFPMPVQYEGMDFKNGDDEGGEDGIDEEGDGVGRFMFYVYEDRS